MALTLPLVFLMIVAIIVVAKSIVVVPRGKVFVLSAFGRPTRVLNAGLNIVPPIISTIAARVPIDEQTLDVPETGGRLQDGTPVAVKGTLRFRVTNPLVAINDVDDYQRALTQVAQTHWQRALEGSDIVRFNTALEAALPVIRTAAATWGIDAIAATTTATVSEDGVRELERRATHEREQRVLAWLAERDESPGPDGRPTASQQAAYKSWSEQAIAEHRDDIDAAARATRASTDAPFQSAPPTSMTFAVARDTILGGNTGRVEVNGREWTAQNRSTLAIAAGFRCIVERQEGNTLIVRPM